MKGCDGKSVGSTGDRHFSGRPPRTNWAQQQAEKAALIERFRKREDRGDSTEGGKP